MAPDEDILGYEEDYESEAEPEELLFGLEEDENRSKRKRGKKPKDELDEIYEQDIGDPEEDIYANEDFENYDPGVGE